MSNSWWLQSAKFISNSPWKLEVHTKHLTFISKPATGNKKYEFMSRLHNVLLFPCRISWYSFSILYVFCIVLLQDGYKCRFKGVNAGNLLGTCSQISLFSSFDIVSSISVCSLISKLVIIRFSLEYTFRISLSIFTESGILVQNSCITLYTGTETRNAPPWVESTPLIFLLNDRSDLN